MQVLFIFLMGRLRKIFLIFLIIFQCLHSEYLIFGCAFVTLLSHVPEHTKWLWLFHFVTLNLLADITIFLMDNELFCGWLKCLSLWGCELVGRNGLVEEFFMDNILSVGHSCELWRFAQVYHFILVLFLLSSSWILLLKFHQFRYFL